MSDASETTPPQATGEFQPAELSEREQKVLAAAMLSLKGGAPDIDYNVLKERAGFNTVKTAQNTWGTIKKKIFPPPGTEGAVPVTPSKAKATPKKRTKKDSDGEDAAAAADGEEGSAKKKVKTPRQKKSDSEEGADNASPKKKTPARKTPAKKGGKKADADAAPAAPADDEETIVKAEATDSPVEEEKTPAAEDAQMAGAEE